MLILTIFVLGLLSILLGFSIWFDRALLLQGLNGHAVESAALAAAVDLGKIIVNDPHYGFVALTDQPPTGKATVSQDGQEQPIQGINTILATARLQMLVAQESGNAELIALAEQDSIAANDAAHLLSKALDTALAGDINNPVYDCNGQAVNPLEDARRVYLNNLRSSFGLDPQLVSFRLSSGWLRSDSSSGISSGISLPLPLSLAQVSGGVTQNGDYKAYVNIPVGTHDFYFAGLGSQPQLVDAKNFVAPDGKRTSSVVRVDATLALKGSVQPGQNKFNPLAQAFSICASACAQPAVGTDFPAPGVLMLSFPNGYVPSIDCLSALMSDYDLRTTNAQLYRAQGGDYPYELNTSLAQENNNTPCSTSREFAKGFRDWMRTAHRQVRIDAALACLNLQFNRLPFDQSDTGSDELTAQDAISTPTNLFCFEFMPDGCIKATHRNRDIYQHELITDKQESSISSATVKSCLVMLSCHDYVNALGTINGGKHAGRALPPGRFSPADHRTSYDNPIAGVTQDITDNSQFANDTCLVLGEPVAQLQQPQQQQQQQLARFWQRDTRRCGGLAVSFQISSMQTN